MTEEKQSNSALFNFTGGKLIEASLNPKDIKDVSTQDDDSLGEISSKDREAETLITMFNSGGIPVGMLSTQQKDVLFDYFFKYNPILNRTLTLFTKLITSSMSLQKPKSTQNDIIQDYVHAFFEKMSKFCKMEDAIKEMIVDFWIHKRAWLLVESNYELESDTDIEFDEDMLLEQISPLTDEELKTIDDIVTKYKSDPMSTTSEERNEVLDLVLLSVNKSYKGVRRIRVIKYDEIIETSSNKEIGLTLTKLRKSENITQFVQKQNLTINKYGADKENDENIAKIIESLTNLGYTYGYVKKHLESSDNFIELTNDPYDSSGCFLIEFSPKDSGIDLNSVIIDLISYHNMLLKQKERTLNMNKSIKIISSEMASQEDFNSMLSQMKSNIFIADGIPVLTANFAVNIEEINFDQRTQYEDDTEETITKRIITGLGIPESLLQATDSYGGSFLKIEAMETEFSTMKDSLSAFVEENFLLPVAIMKGFISTDLWGNVYSIYPSIDWKIGSLINKSDFFNTLQSLVQDGSLPKSVLLDYLGFDSDTMRQQIKKEQEENNDEGNI